MYPTLAEIYLALAQTHAQSLSEKLFCLIVHFIYATGGTGLGKQWRTIPSVGKTPS